MTSSVRFPTSPKASFGKVRVRAQAVWRGPNFIYWKPVDDDTTYYGWPVLALEANRASTDHVESRQVYANIYSDYQAYALLRAVYWNGEAARKCIHATRAEDFQLVMPAAFVLLPARQLEVWISRLSGLRVSLSSGEDDFSVDIRNLCVQLNYEVGIFEKAWMTKDQHHVELNQLWDEIWTEMTEILTKEPAFTRFQETFWLRDIEFEYDFQSYEAGGLSPR